MASTMDAVEKQFRDLGKEGLLKKKESAFLPEIMRSEERILFVSQCLAEAGSSLFLVTSERLLFLHKGFKALKQTEYDYASIHSVSCKLDLLLAKVILFSGDKKVVIDSLENKDAPEIVSLISGQVPNEVSPSTHHSAAQQEASSTSIVTPPSEPKKKGGCFKKIFLGVVGIIAVIAIMGSLGGERAPSVLLSEGDNLFFEKKDGKISFGYKQVAQEDTSITRRKRMHVRIQASRDLLVAEDEDLKAITKTLREITFKNTEVLSLFIHFPPRKDGTGDVVIHYAEDKKGFSGDQDLEWEIHRYTKMLDDLERFLESEEDDDEDSEDAYADVDLSAPRLQVRKLLDELLAYKESAEFREKGFGTGSKRGNGWLESVKVLRDEFEKRDYPFDLKIAPGNLIMLGLEYLSTKGTENKDTKYFRNEVDKGLR